MSAKHPALARVIAFYEGLVPGDVSRLRDLYAPDAYFRDPFNEVRGRTAIEKVFAKMFHDLDDVKFTITDAAIGEAGAFLIWEMSFRMKRYKPRVVHVIHGASHLKLDAAGRISYHRDYWDAANELYSKLPLIGPVMRWLRRRLG